MGIIRLFLLYAILIFAKKAPKLIMDLLKIKGEGIGLKGLSIKNKMGEAALVGGAVKKGMTAAEGSIKKTAGGALSGFLNTKGGLSARLAGAGKGAASGIISGGREALAKGDTKGMFTGAIKDVGNFARNGEPSLWSKAKAPLQKISGNIESKGYNSIEQSRMKEAEAFKQRLTNMYGPAAAKQLLGTLKVDFSDANSYSNYKDSLKKMTESTSGSYGGFAANDLYTKENILKERNKALSAIENLSTQLNQALQSGDAELADAIKENMSKQFIKAQNKRLFDEYSNLNISAVELGKGVDSSGNPLTGDDLTNSQLNYLRADLVNTVMKTKKAADAATKDIENSEKKPTPSSTGGKK